MYIYLVPQPLAGNHCDLIADALVGLEVECEFRVVSLDDDLCGLLDRLRPDATHVGGYVMRRREGSVSVSSIVEGSFNNAGALDWRCGNRRLGTQFALPSLWDE